MKNDYEIRGEVTAIFLKRRNGLVLETLISTTDLEKVKSFPGRWFAMRHGSKSRFYVKGHTPMVRGKQEVHLLHRWLFDNPKGLDIYEMAVDSRLSNVNEYDRAFIEDEEKRRALLQVVF